MNKTSHITQMLKDKTDRNREEKKYNFTGSRDSVELKLMRWPTRRQSNQSKKTDSQLLLAVADLKAQWKKKGKEELHSFCETPNGAEAKATSKGTTGMNRVRGSAK
jgi:hypothetical protein